MRKIISIIALVLFCYPALAYSPVSSPVRSPVSSPVYNPDAAAAVAAAGDSTLSGVLASTVFELDATDAASYPGSGTTWMNLTASPADGSAQTAYDFYTGNGSTSTTYPTFNGSAGSAAAYWSFDGADYFNLKSGANTTFFKSLHKTTGGSDWWMMFTVYLVAVDIQVIAGTGNTGTASQRAIQITANAGGNNNFSLGQRGDTTAPLINTANNLYTDLTPTLVIVSHSHSSNTTRYWINTSTAVSAAQSYNATTTDPLVVFRISGRANAEVNFIASGSRMYSIAMGNEYLDDTKAGLIIAYLENKHNRNYAQNDGHNPGDPIFPPLLAFIAVLPERVRVA